MMVDIKYGSDASEFYREFDRYKRAHLSTRIIHDILDEKRVIRVEGEGEIPALPYDPILVNHFVSGEWTAWYDNIEKV